MKLVVCVRWSANRWRGKQLAIPSFKVCVRLQRWTRLVRAYKCFPPEITCSFVWLWFSCRKHDVSLPLKSSTLPWASSCPLFWENPWRKYSGSSSCRPDTTRAMTRKNIRASPTFSLLQPSDLGTVWSHSPSTGTTGTTGFYLMVGTAAWLVSTSQFCTNFYQIPRNC